MLENQFQSDLVKELKVIFPGCFVLKNDPTFLQGFPDLMILFQNKWACLECKRSKTASHRPNQDYYVEKLKDMSYAEFICPENKKEILDDLRRFFADR